MESFPHINIVYVLWRINNILHFLPVLQGVKYTIFEIITALKKITLRRTIIDMFLSKKDTNE